MRVKYKNLLGIFCWTAAIFVIAAVDVGTQLDRQSRLSEPVARIVPAVFRSYAWETLARQAYSEGKNTLGLEYSRELLFRRPVPAESLSLFTNGLLTAGQLREALPPLVLSAQRGWRDRYTQQLVISSSQETGDLTVASQRLLALWRQGDKSRETRAITQIVLRQPEALKLFAEGMIQADHWGTEFLAWAIDAGGPNMALSVASSMSEKHIKADCHIISQISKKFALMGNAKPAISIWSLLCSSVELPGIRDFSFNKDLGSVGPFEWEYPEQSGVSVELNDSSEGVVLQYDNSQQVRVPVATRVAALPTGNYAVDIESNSSLGISERAIVLQVACFSRRGSWGIIQRITLLSSTEYITIPHDCLGQKISVLAGHGSGNIRRLHISDANAGNL